MKKRVGMIIDSLIVSKQINDLIQSSNSSANYEITTLIINNQNKTKSTLLLKIIDYAKRRGIKKLLSTSLFILICKFEEFFIKRYGTFVKFYKKYKLSEGDYELISVYPVLSKNGLVYDYTKSDIEKIKNSKLDLIIRAGGGILKGEILHICPNGIISFHHGDNYINRGGPPGFWEVYERIPRTGFVIQKLKDELDGGDVLFRGFIKTNWSYSLNLIKLYEVASPFLHKVIEDITSEQDKIYYNKKSPYSYPLYTTPNLYQSLAYILKTSFILLNKVIRFLRGKTYRWGIAYQFTDDWKDVTLWRSKKIPNPNNSFLADPFVIKRDGKYYCFVENYNYKTCKGNISVFQIDHNGYEDLGIALKEDFHLSYPFLFNYKNELYMCPETNQKKEIRIYKCIKFPNQWAFHKTIMKDVSSVDSVIFQKNDKWWLFTNIDRSSMRDHSCQLHIFYASDPLTDNWTPHESNPVIFDPLEARNGGLIVDDENVYRIFQRQGFDMYGSELGIAKINKLNNLEYDEEIISEVKARFFKNILGTHTYNYNEGLLVIDFVQINKKTNGI